MTPERVAELAEVMKLPEVNVHLRLIIQDTVKSLITIAVAEQKEIDAKIADRLSTGNKAGGELSAGQIIAATTIAQAIRGQP